MQIKALKLFLHRTEAKYGILFCHHNADPDAIFSAYVFTKLLKRLKPKLRCEITAVNGPSHLTKLLTEHVPVKLVSEPQLEKADFVALLDTSTTKQLDEWGERLEAAGKPVIILDHHAPHPKTLKLAALKLVDRKAHSACEIVYNLFREGRISLTRKDALALLLGIAAETRSLRYASASTFRVVADLVSKGVSAEKVLTAIFMPLSRSERFARLKAASRHNLHRVGRWILASSHVNSHEASASRALLGLGADVAVVAGQKAGALRVSLRSTSSFFKDTGIDLGRDVAMPLGERLKGMGGGHPTSAGVNGYGDPAYATAEAVNIFKAKLCNIPE